uniref:Uncharacterized protein n=1 Tax=Salvator merianae TaxID=96440 RepID=A0A8D0DXE9_SALMN
ILCHLFQPFGESSKSWDCFQMHIRKHVIDFHSLSEIFKQITFISVKSDVRVGFIIASV